MDPHPLPTSFYEREVHTVARELLGKVLVAPAVCGRIYEVEAYGGTDDPGSHGWRGPTPRTQVMHGPPGRWYIYLIYGMHLCANIVADVDGVCGAVLLRAVLPLSGVETMRQRRPKARRDADLCNGPAKLTSAFAMTLDLNGVALDQAPVTVVDDGFDSIDYVRTPRIGLSAGRGEDLPWRYVADSATVAGASSSWSGGGKRLAKVNA